MRGDGDSPSEICRGRDGESCRAYPATPQGFPALKSRTLGSSFLQKGYLMAKTELLQYRRIAVHVFYTDGEENLEEFISIAQMLYYN